MSERTEVTFEGRRLSVSNLDKVLYPATGFTKGDLIDYYVNIAPVLAPHLQGRGVTLHRFPDGVGEDSFFEKRCPRHRPDWVEVAPGPGEGRDDGIDYCVLADAPSLAWAANLAAIELHAPLHVASDAEHPTALVFDLDPGPGTDITDCAGVALELAELLDRDGLAGVAKTSGSKGLQLYVPLNGEPRAGLKRARPTYERTRAYALTLATELEEQHPDRVVTTMAKQARRNKVFIDWSQNHQHKTTIAVYSLRGREHPTASTPLTWDEVDEAAAGTPWSFTAEEVRDRVDDLGDLFEPVITDRQALPDVDRSILDR
ncbi:MAG: non-homologous end-joining DNA ligase [Acidimicrobiales bacterium]